MIMTQMDPLHYESELEIVSTGETIFHAGERGEKMYVVAQGQVDIMVQGKTVESVSSGGILGEMALLGSSERSATAVASKDSKLLPIDEAFFMNLVRKSPQFSLQVMRVMADRLRRLDASLP